ncbi:MAG TPA: CYTH domain-containing protein [Candidatus Obscuribacter sp.]|nr:CYTH domain-containing protein [Candidatus Obscuribacter sp.]MBK9277576.1 CYTH domain-containing protein [Candidatus Obscuribacter sp.]MBL8085624.1 CYTH domain-containing protein [Candidatus Obscuribacter sp.]HMW89504.1 CYTH domain-containing protein [Candidatus Obscuribacter sp.]HMY54378.1 CYTH domain-containing protein [Candidatus Obscuribacter sp.]
MGIFTTALSRMFTARRPLRSQSDVAGRKPANAAKGAAVFEVERKFRLKDGEASTIPTRLKAMGFVPVEDIEMTDVFLPTPVQGEMLRVRTEVSDARSHTVVTIKEWVTIGNSRERQETEDGVNGLEKWLLLRIGRLISGRKLLSFTKTRLMHESSVLAGVVIAIDNVQGLGENSGHYAEIEVIVPQGGDVEGARRQIVELAGRLFGEERDFVQASYQDMLKQVSAN